MTRRVLLATIFLGLVGCGEPPHTPPTEAIAASAVHELDFAGERHSLAVALHPELRTWTPRELERADAAVDLTLRNESGHDLTVTGNGRRSVMFVGNGRDVFDKVCGCDDLSALRTAFPNSDLYFSPRLRSEQAVAGAVFLANVERDNAAKRVARVFVEHVGDAQLTLRVSMGPSRTSE